MSTTNPTAGQNAIVQVKVGATLVTMTGITTADLATATDIYEITDLNSNQWKLKLAGLSDYTLKLDGNHDLSDAQQAALQGFVITTPGTIANFKVWPTGLGGSGYAGSAFIKTMDVKVDVKSQNTISFDLEGSGPLTYS